MSSNAFAQIEREENEAEALREHMKMERKAEQNELKEEGNEMTSSNTIIADLQSRNAELDAIRAQEPVEIVEPNYNEMAMGCGLEDRSIHNRYEAMRHGWDCAVEKMFEQLHGPLYAHAPDSAARIAELEQSLELRTSRTEYLTKLKKYGAQTMPATAHYTAGYKDGSAILDDVAKLCAEAETRLLAVEKQRDELLAALLDIRATNASKHGTQGMMIRRCIEIATDAIASAKGGAV